MPTWNYSAVHAYGTPRLVENTGDVRALLDDTVETFEAGLPEPWSTARVGDEYIGKMAQGIVAGRYPHGVGTAQLSGAPHVRSERRAPHPPHPIR